METTYPQASATLVRSRGCYLWLVPRCPLCGRKHQHGGGILDGDPRRYLSHRVADCGRGGYMLMEQSAKEGNR